MRSKHALALEICHTYHVCTDLRKHKTYIVHQFRFVLVIYFQTSVVDGGVLATKKKYICPIRSHSSRIHMLAFLRGGPRFIGAFLPAALSIAPPKYAGSFVVNNKAALFSSMPSKHSGSRVCACVHNSRKHTHILCPTIHCKIYTIIAPKIAAPKRRSKIPPLSLSHSPAISVVWSRTHSAHIELV